MKLTISKNQWVEIGDKTGWLKNASHVYKGDKCPKCNNDEHIILNPSQPTINECTKCKHQWNPYNKKSSTTKTALIKGDGYSDGGEPYTNEEMDLMEKQDQAKNNKTRPSLEGVQNYEKSSIPKIPGYYLIKEHQRWGRCPTYRNETNKDDVLFLDKGKLLNWEEMKQELKENWRPVNQEDSNWFVANLG